MRWLGSLFDDLIWTLPAVLFFAVLWGAGLGPIHFHP